MLGQLSRRCRAHHFVTSDLGVYHLAYDKAVGKSHYKPILRRLVFIFVLSDEFMTLTIVSLSLYISVWHRLSTQGGATCNAIRCSTHLVSFWIWLESAWSKPCSWWLWQMACLTYYLLQVVKELLGQFLWLRKVAYHHPIGSLYFQSKVTCYDYLLYVHCTVQYKSVLSISSSQDSLNVVPASSCRRGLLHCNSKTF